MFTPYKQVITLCIISITAYIALEALKAQIKQLKLNVNSVEGKALLDLKLLLNEKENLEIHKNVRGDSGIWSKTIHPQDFKNPDTWRKIDNYLGILELINILIDKGVISLNTFNSQFGYRIDNIFFNKQIMNYVKSYDDGTDVLWVELFKLFRKRNLKYRNLK